MKKNVQTFINIVKKAATDPYTLRYFGLAMLLFILQWVVFHLIFNPISKSAFEQDIQSALNELENYPSSSESLDSLNRITFLNSTNSDFKNNPFLIQHYNSEGTLEFWNKPTHTFPLKLLNEVQNNVKYFQYFGENYLAKSINYNGNFILVGIPLERYLEERYTKYNFSTLKNQKYSPFYILGFPSPNAYSLKAKDGSFLCAVGYNSNTNIIKIIFSLGLLIFGFINLLFSIYNFSKIIAEHYSIIGCLIFAGILNFLRTFLLKNHLPEQFYMLKLFNPSLYSSSLLPSLGDLLIFVFMIQYILVFLNRYLKISLPIKKNSTLGFILFVAALVFLVGEAFSITKIFERLVIESSIWFNYNYYPRLNLYSFIGLSIMLLIFSNYYSLTNLVLKGISKFQLDKKKTIAAFALFLVLIIGSIVKFHYKTDVIVVLLIMYGFLIVFYARHYFNYNYTVYNGLTFLFFASIVTSYLLIVYNKEKESLIMDTIASEVAFGYDKKLELKIQDYFVDFANPSRDTTILSQIIIKPIEPIEYQNWSSNIDVKTIYESSALQIDFSSSISNKKYLVAVFNTSKPHYYVIYPKNYINTLSENRKTELNDIIIRENKVNYALYQNDSLIAQMGQYPYSNRYSGSKIKSDNNIPLLSDYDHSEFEFTNGIRTIVTTKKTNPETFFIQFSYIFFFNAILYILAILIIETFLSNSRFGYKTFQFNSLGSKIGFYLMIFVLGMFMFIAYFSYENLYRKFQETNRDELLNNVNVIQNSIAAYSQDQKSYNIDELIHLLQGFSNSNFYEINLYDNFGKKIYSTNKMLSSASSDVLDPDVYWKILHNVQRVFEEKMDNNNMVYSISSKLETNPNNFKHIVSYSTLPNLTSNRDASGILVSLYNLYIFLFFIALALVYWMSNFITKPINKLSSKLSSFDISKKNEPLIYNEKDEIGELVKRYNTMVGVVEESTQKLAEAEREGAWNEMAKQVAHEIKNPLTPMKLKLQLLQRKIDANEDNIVEYMEQVIHTLSEQISNLESIADSFNMYARLNNPKIEVYDWIPVIKSTISLYEDDRVKIHYDIEVQTALVKMEKNQMISCLNNLVKNAIQADPSEIVHIHIILKSKGAGYELTIQDKGSGIKDENLIKIFKPNFTTKSSGTGLGLAITKKSIDSIGGTIRFETKEKEGTSFIIYLPKAN